MYGVGRFQGEERVKVEEQLYAEVYLVWNLRTYGVVSFQSDEQKKVEGGVEWTI